MDQHVYVVPVSVVSSLRDRTTQHIAQQRHAEMPDEDRWLSCFTVNNWLPHCKKPSERGRKCISVSSLPMKWNKVKMPQ